ncbi:MAG: ornithine cyclodeaminase family protein [Chloroflexi bacterium]|nr:ornithine cyclodeaminase family protein [Chloroflexota bacterium]
MALLLDRAAIQGLLDMKQAIAIMEQAFAELANGSVEMPQRTAMPDPQRAGLALFMPAHLKGMGALGIKNVTVYRNNPANHGLPTTLATITLLDPGTGAALAIMDGGYITAMRTGATCGVATRYMARQEASVAGVLGMGVQARTQLSGICAVRPIRRAVCFSVDAPPAQTAFVEQMSRELGIPVEVARSVQEVVEQADVLALATSAQQPIMSGRWLRPGTHINSVGSHTPDAREMDTECVTRASKVVCDLTSACMAEAGDFLIPIREGAFARERIHGDLGEMVTGRKRGRDNPSEITLFKTVGLSVEDIATAHFVYQEALRRGVGASFDF